MDEVTGGWGKLYSEELHNFYYISPSVIVMTISRRIKWLGNAAFVGSKRRQSKSCWVNLKEGDIWEDVDGSIILKLS
jgi:hypothetical protein